MTPTRRTVLAGIAATAALPSYAAETEAARVIRIDPALDRIVLPDARIDVLATGYKWAEGPVWVPRHNALFFSDVPGNVVHRWRRGAGARPFLDPSGLRGKVPPSIREAGANGLALDRAGRLLLADSGTRALTRVDLATRRREIVVDRFEGKRFNSPNDLIVLRDGTIYFTDPTYGLAGLDASPLRELDFKGVFRLAPDGRLDAVLRDLVRPNGIGLSPDERTLYVAQSEPEKPEVLAYTLDDRGVPLDRRLLRDMRPQLDAGLEGSADGMDVAADGTLFASGPGGIHVLAPDGKLLGIIATGKRTANACVGEGGRSLFMTASDRLCRIDLVV